jgi:hypothetical protein
VKILRLRIHAMGPLQGFDTGPFPLPGMVVISGPNEAGKSTLLAGIRAALHGFYPASRDRNPWAPWGGEEAELMAWLESAEGTSFRVHRRLLSTPWGRLVTGAEARVEAADPETPHLLPEGAREEDLRNNEVPPVRHVSVKTYEQVHAVTLPELTALAATDAWAEVRDRMLAGMATRDMASPSAVIARLDADAAALWRWDRRGRSRARELDEARSRAHRALVEARVRDEALRGSRSAFTEAEETLSRLREELAGVERRLREVRSLLPARGPLREVRRLEALAGALPLLQGLPTDPVTALELALEQEADAWREREEAQAEVFQLQGAAAPPTETDAAWGRAAPELRSLRDRLLRAEAGEERRGALEVELAGLEAEVRESAGGILRPGTDPLEGARVLRSVEVEGLRGVLERRDRARERLRGAQGRLEVWEKLPEPAPPATRTPGTFFLLLGMATLLVLAGVAVLAWGEGGPLPAALTLAGALALGIVAWSVHRSDEIRRARHGEAVEARLQDGRPLREEVATAGKEVEAAVAAVEALVADLPLDGEVLEVAGGAALASVQRLAGLSRRWEERRVALQGLRDGVEKALEGILEWEAPAGDAAAAREGLEGGLAAADLLATARRQLEAWEARAEEGGRRVADGERDTTRREAAAEHALRAHRRWEAVCTALEGLAVRLRRAEHPSPPAPGSGAVEGEVEGAVEGAVQGAVQGARGGSAGVGSGAGAGERPGSESGFLARKALRDEADGLRELAAVLATRMEAARQAADLRRNLERSHPEFGSLEALDAAVLALEGEFAAAPDAPLVPDRLEATQADLKEELETALREREHHRTLLAEAEGVLTPDQAEGELAALDEARDEVRRERDRLFVLSRVVAVAERGFRERHQPELLRRAESVLRDFTGGRWTRLRLGLPGARDRGSAELEVRGPAEPGGRPVDTPLSTGTREQIWFALRLAVVELAEAGGEALPLVLDETLVNWDAARRRAGLETLAREARRRQIFLLTCHPWLAEEAVAAGAQHLRLEGAR